MLKLIISILIASLFWFVMFSPWTSSHINFWYVMLGATATLTILSLYFGRDWKHQFRFNIKDIAIGFISAVVLYGVFYWGNIISNMLFDFTHTQVSQLYAIKNGQNKIFLGLVLLFWIGPAEEFFWRGYVQRTLENKTGKTKALIITTLIYTFVHIWAFNLMLLIAAVICGMFWGLIYSKNKNLLTVLLSHAIWDTAIFILYPIS